MDSFSSYFGIKLIKESHHTTICAILTGIGNTQVAHAQINHFFSLKVTRNCVSSSSINCKLQLNIESESTTSQKHRNSGKASKDLSGARTKPRQLLYP